MSSGGKANRMSSGGQAKRMFSWMSGSTGSASTPPNGITKISDKVYLLCEPNGPADIEIVFIHGLQIKDYEHAFWKTWMARDEHGKDLPNSCWPTTWLKEDFPRARMLSLSYDSSALKTGTTGDFQPYILGESLVIELVNLGKVGERDCPIVFVCHSLGGLVVKEMVVRAHYSFRDEQRMKNFLKNIAGFFFYATPHNGSAMANLARSVAFDKTGPMIRYLELLNNEASRKKSEFEQLGQQPEYRGWKYSVIAEARKTTCGPFSQMVVEEGSARISVDNFVTVADDHIGVCKPKSEHATSYVALKDFLLSLKKDTEPDPNAIRKNVYAAASSRESHFQGSKS